MTIGVYMIFIGDYFYHGSSGDCDKRCKTHFEKLKNNKHCNPKMQNAFNKYQHFDYQIVVCCNNRDIAYSYEQDFINAHFGLEKYLNLNATASKPPSREGRTFSEESKQKMSESRKGKKIKPHSEEHKQKLSEAAKGKKKKPFSEEARKRMSEAAKARWARKAK